MCKRAFFFKVGNVPLPELQWKQQEGRPLLGQWERHRREHKRWSEPGQMLLCPTPFRGMVPFLLLAMS